MSYADNVAGWRLTPDAPPAAPQPSGVEHAPWVDAGLDSEPLRPTGFIEWFVVAQTLLPALLFLPGSQAFRMPLRVGTYGIALGGLAYWWLMRSHRSSERHPAAGWLILALGYLSLMIAHPLTSSLLAGVAQALLYLAVFSAVFWAPSFVDRPRQLVRILALLLVCNGTNSMVGVLQVYDPDRFMPRELSFAYTTNRHALDAATYVGADGRRIVRPPGLFDTPGAVCGPGTIAALLGLIFALERFVWWKRAAAFAFSVAGIAAIYLSQVRTNLVVVVGMMAVYFGVLMLQRQKQRAIAFGTLAGGIVLAGLLAAMLLGGRSIQQRFATLLEEDPRDLYYASRGLQVQHGFDHLAVEYPFGAGLGRWGMMRGYFGDPSHLDSSEIWAEVQPNAWILDGGLVLLGLYGAALVSAALFGLKLATSLESPDDQRWAAAVTAVNVGTLALVFTFVPFTTQVGLQYWFLEGALVGAMAARARL
jgi:hypothetical protein